LLTFILIIKRLAQGITVCKMGIKMRIDNKLSGTFFGILLSSLKSD